MRNWPFLGHTVLLSTGTYISNKQQEQFPPTFPSETIKPLAFLSFGYWFNQLLDSLNAIVHSRQYLVIALHYCHSIEIFAFSIVVMYSRLQ